MVVRARAPKTATFLFLGLIGACGGSAPAPDDSSYTPPTAAAAGSGGTTGAAGQPATPPGPVLNTPPAPTAGATAPSPDSTTKVVPCGVAKVVVKNCQTCHGATPIGGAPMPLVTFDDFHKPAKTMPTKQVYQLVEDRIHDTNRPMPPIDKLSATDTTMLDQWLKGGALTGPAADATCDTKPTGETGKDPTAMIPEQEYTRGRITPTAGEVCYDFKVHASQTEVDDNPFVIDPGELYEQFYYNVPWPAGSVATAYATVADNAQVLHHWLLFSTAEAQTEGSHIYAPVPTLIGTDPVLLAGWAVGGPNLNAPADVGFELPDPGMRTINVQWHFYNSTATSQSDKSVVQICVVPKETKAHIGGVTWLGTEDLNGNVWTGGAGMPPFKESTFKTTCLPGRGGLSTDESIHIIGFEPHMHRIGKHMMTAVRHMDGTMETIFDKPFSFGNETHYYAAYELKPGESLDTSCTFMNDTANGVPFGESTNSEMCYQFTFAYPAHSMTNGAFSLLGVTDACW